MCIWYVCDVQNGYVGYVSVDSDEDGERRQVIECCVWNYADKMHKLLAISNDLVLNGKPEAGQYTGITVYKYNNASRTMKVIPAQDLGVTLDTPPGTTVTSHALPRQGKTAVFTYYIPLGKIEKRLKWDGSYFKYSNSTDFN